MNHNRKIINLLSVLYFPVAVGGGRNVLPARERTEYGSPSGATMTPFKKLVSPSINSPHTRGSCVPSIQLFGQFRAHKGEPVAILT